MRICASTSVVLLVVLANHCHAQRDEQSARQNQPAPEALSARLIEDPTTHARWILFKDPSHPAFPGRLIPVCVTPNSEAATGRHSPLPVSAILHPTSIIHAGDALIVEQHTPMAEVSLVATALGPAAVGETLRVRLKNSGRIFSVRAESSGHATLVAGQTGVRW